MEKVSLEAKYLYRMLDAMVGNAWRTELARTVVLPYVNKYMEKNNGKLPSMASIRNKCNI